MKTRLKLSDGDQISRRAFWLLFDQCKDFVDMATVGKKRTRVSRASLLTVRQSELIHRRAFIKQELEEFGILTSDEELAREALGTMKTWLIDW